MKSLSHATPRRREWSTSLCWRRNRTWKPVRSRNRTESSKYHLRKRISQHPKDQDYSLQTEYELAPADKKQRADFGPVEQQTLEIVRENVTLNTWAIDSSKHGTSIHCVKFAVDHQLSEVEISRTSHRWLLRGLSHTVTRLLGVGLRQHCRSWFDMNDSGCLLFWSVPKQIWLLANMWNEVLTSLLI